MEAGKLTKCGWHHPIDWGPGQNKEKGRWAPPFVTFCFLSRRRHVARCFMSPWSCHLLRDQLYSPSLSWKKLLSCFCQVFFFFSNKESNQYKHFNINWLGFKSFAMEWNQLSRRMGRVYSWSSHLPLPSSTVLFNVLIMCCLIYQITSALDVGKSSLHSCQLCLAKKKRETGMGVVSENAKWVSHVFIYLAMLSLGRTS